MFRFSAFPLLICGAWLAASALANTPNDEAIEKDQQRLEGTWQVTSLTINGNKVEERETNKITVVNGDDGSWSVHSEGEVISKGTSRLNPEKKPKTIDFTATEGGGKGQQFRGIYRLKKKTRKLCFAPAGNDRPMTFSSTAENQHILVTFKRIKPD